MFQRKKLSDVIITAVAAMACSQQVMGQDADAIEEVSVTGIRASLERSMDVKRDSAGVVDAISSEDIGKFPDTNLAESLQRITGVSIDRVNGEGAEVTIRGFGAGNNMVTLNGRTMPGGVAFGGGSGAGATRGGQSRAFNFANLASESVSGVEVYKTSKASIATGGIGGTVNIKTAKPLEDPGYKLSLGAKMVNDTTNVNGDDYTPEVSGIFSWTDDSETWGVSLSGSVQERDSGSAGSTVNNWNIGTWGEDNLYGLRSDAEVINAPENGQLYARPNDVRYTWSDRERERTNAQLTVQFRPMDDLTLTGDYTYANNDLYEFRSEQTFWMDNGNSIKTLEFDNSAVASPIFVEETWDTVKSKDMGFEQQLRQQEDTLESFGFNADWQVNDAFSLALDVHDSNMESLPAGPGNSGSIDISVAAPVGQRQAWDFSGDLPAVNFDVNDSIKGNNNGQLDAGDFGSQMARVWYASQESDITQIKLDGALEFDNGRFDFGVETRDMTSLSRQSNRQWTLGDWGVNDAGAPGLAGLLEPFSLTGQFDDFGTAGATDVGFRAKDPLALCEWAVANYPVSSASSTPANAATSCSYNPDFSTNNQVEEETAAAYFQVAMSSELGGFPVNYLAGLRYETTDVSSTSVFSIPGSLIWQDNNDFIRPTTPEKQRVSESASYDHLLPSFDFDINLREDLKGRFSYSKTIARAGLGNLAATSSGWSTTGSTVNGTVPTASSSNTGLVPLESDNLDLSVEWYYDDSSYVSLGFYEKRVDNFIGNGTEDRTFFDMRDVTSGPRAQAAIAELESRGIAVDDNSLFSMMVVMENQGNPNVTFPSVCGADPAAMVGDSACQGEIGALTDANGKAVDLSANADDPQMVFRTSLPVNQKEAKINGFEFALQHFFGDSGFGFQANYTTVRGDVGFNNLADPGEQQFALLGLSDTANLVGIYENYGVQARLAYNWRDDFLSQANRGSYNNPTYVEAFAQWDLSVSYEFNDNLDLFFEGINLAGEDVRHVNRSTKQLWFLEELGARYQVGARYAF